MHSEWERRRFRFCWNRSYFAARLAKNSMEKEFNWKFSVEFAIKIRRKFFPSFSHEYSSRREEMRGEDKSKDLNWIFFSVCLIRIAQNLIKRGILAAILINSQKERRRRRIGDQKKNRKSGKSRRHSPSLHLKCASAHAFPANLEWETTRYNESMRDHNHRICCYLNCSVSYSKNAHRYRGRYLMRMSMMLYTTRGSVLVVDDCVRCDRRGMKASKATLCQENFLLLLLSRLLSSLLTTVNDDDVFKWARKEKIQAHE
jgi:hypothetical protein